MKCSSWRTVDTGPSLFSYQERFGHIECKVGTDWIRPCMTMEVDGTGQRNHPRKT